jgi:BMFP domain-containing protein YqiC
LDIDLLADHEKVALCFAVLCGLAGGIRTSRLQGNPALTRRKPQSIWKHQDLKCDIGIAIVWIAPASVVPNLLEIRDMTQTSNRFFDEIGRLMNDAAGAAQGVKREVDTAVRNQAEKILRDLDVVKREEFEAVKDMARLAREENEALKTRIAALEAKLGVSPSAPDQGSLKTDG